MRKPLVATVLISAVAGAVIAGLAPAAAATSDSDGSPHNRGWDSSSSSKNRGWDHDERAGHSDDSE
jgi:Spy/CpxP family protein refolding chaperone